MTRFNILYLHSHDTGRYIQPYGHAVPTPQLRRLAEEGVLFRQAFAAAPTCSPSRAALLTGQWAHSSGMLGLAHYGFTLRDYSQHIVHTLRRAGYYSVLCGVQHVARDANAIGYDRVIAVGTDRRAAKVLPGALEFLSSGPPQPFFADIGFFETHRPFLAAGHAEDPRFTLPPPTVPDTPETRQDMANFKASARELDRGLGVVLDALEAAGLADSTLVICTTDHGIAFPGMKCNLTDHGIGVMLILRLPRVLQQVYALRNFRPGEVCDAMVSQIDIFPTICELLDLSVPPWLEGKSLVPLLGGHATEIREEVFAEVTYHAAYEPQRAVRTRRWKYIRRFEDRRFPVLPNCDDSPSKEVWLRHGWQQRYIAPEQLYDLVFDPNETHNLVTDPAAHEILADMRQRLDRWMHHTDDPLLRGPVPAPPGVTVHNPDDIYVFGAKQVRTGG